MTTKMDKLSFLTTFLLTICSFSLLAQSHIVFVHGATGGGWNWKAMDVIMSQEGFSVSRPTLTGLGERAHLANTEIDLEMHIQDVINHILFEDLHDIVLVGHSYGGMVITGVADQLKDRITKIIYIDAHVPENGVSAVTIRKNREKGIKAAEKDGYFAPTWIDPSKTPGDRKQSMATLTQKIKLNNIAGNNINGAYILTAEGKPENDAFGQYLEVAKAKNWKVVIMKCGHNPQNTHREELKKVLLGLIQD